METIEKNSNSLFSDMERNNHQKVENVLVKNAKCGDFDSLLNFWKNKRTLFKQRCFEKCEG